LIAFMAGRRARAEIDRAPSPMEGRSLATGAIFTGAAGFITSLYLLLVILLNRPE